MEETVNDHREKMTPPVDISWPLLLCTQWGHRGQMHRVIVVQRWKQYMVARVEVMHGTYREGSPNNADLAIAAFKCTAWQQE